MAKIKLSEEQKKMADALTSLQRKVVINVVSGMSNRQAYKKAGGKAKTQKAQDTSVSQILSNHKSRIFYESLMNQAAENAVITKEKAISILDRMASVTIKDFYDFKRMCIDHDEAGEPIYANQWIIKSPEDMPTDIARCIKSYKIGKNGPEIEIYDRQGAIKQLSNMIGWDAPKKTELTGAEGAALEVKTEVNAPEIANALTGLLGKL